MWRKILLGLPLLILACSSAPRYQSCPMPESMKQECSKDKLSDECKNYGVNCNPSCVVVDHPQCAGDPCLIYNYEDPLTHEPVSSTPFCSMKCNPPEDENGNVPLDWDHTAPECGSEGLCMPYLDGYYCVPRKFFTKPQTPQASQ